MEKSRYIFSALSKTLGCKSIGSAIVLILTAVGKKDILEEEKLLWNALYFAVCSGVAVNWNADWQCGNVGAGDEWQSGCWSYNYCHN